MSARFSEFCLEIREQGFRGNLHILDFASFEPNTPTGEDLLHFFFHTISELASILENIVESQVSNSVSDDRYCHIFKFVVCISWHLLFQIFTESLVGPEWSLVFSVDAPNEHACDSNTLHFRRNLFRDKIDLADQSWKFDDLVSWHGPCCHTDTFLDHITVSNDEHPLVGLCFDPEIQGELESSLASEAHDSKWDDNFQEADKGNSYFRCLVHIFFVF